MPIEPVTVSCHGVTKAYGDVMALRGIDLEVHAGEVFGFLGPNGAGKTTLIRCLLDMIRPDAGTLQVMGKCPQAESVAVRRETGYLPGELHLDQTLTVKQTLQLFRRLRRNTVSEHEISVLTERLQLDQRRPIKHLSKGNKQKVGIIQAFMHRPKFLLLDEPTSGLDPIIQQEVLALVGEARARGATVFFSSHHLNETQQVADRVAMVRAGEVIACDTTVRLLKSSWTTVRVSLERPLPRQRLQGVPGVLVTREVDEREWTLAVQGMLDELLGILAGHGVRRFETRSATLDEVFFSHYQSNQ